MFYSDTGGCRDLTWSCCSAQQFPLQEEGSNESHLFTCLSNQPYRWVQYQQNHREEKTCACSLATATERSDFGYFTMRYNPLNYTKALIWTISFSGQLDSKLIKVHVIIHPCIYQFFSFRDFFYLGVHSY